MSAGKTLRLVQVSDTHLSRTHAWFTDNFDAFAAQMQAAPPDLIVHTGDVAFNGPDAPDDLAFGAACLARLPRPWRVIPGNHDVGEAPQGEACKQPVNTARCALWRGHFGEGWWAQDFGAWRLIGLDTSLLDSGLPDEAKQRAFFTETLAARGTRSVLVFTHMPPFLNEADDAKFTRGALNLPERKTFLDQCESGGVRAIACGHLHIYRALKHRGIDIVWAPSTSYVNMPSKVSDKTIVPRAGYVEWLFDGERLTHRVVEPPELMTIDLHRWIVERGSVTGLPERWLKTISAPA
jgi:3',5'-cyclic AMP phosphodiesterase CpdA